MIEATQRKIHEAQFFLRRLNSEREQLFESEPGAFRHYLSAFLSAGESVRYLLQNIDKKKYDECLSRLPEDTDRDLLTFMNGQRRKEVHSEGAETTAELELIPDIELSRASLSSRGHPAYGVHFFGPPGIRAAQIHRPVHYFAGDETDLIAKCALYLGLLEKLLREFATDYA